MIAHFKPYIELARLNRPAGFMLLFWPCSWAIIMTGQSSAIIYYNIIIFLVGAIAMRSAGCILNDIIDRDIDAKVERTKNRPLASGRLTVNHALVLLFFMLLNGFFVFLLLNTIAKMWAIIGFLIAIIYPFTKRFFGYPQLLLGLAFSSGVMVSWAALDGHIGISCFLLYFASVFWTIGYDTIYGHQDKKDDLIIGVRSSSISFGKNSKSIILLCFSLTYMLICYAGYMENFKFIFILCLPAFLNMVYLTMRVNLEKPEDCMETFRAIAFITGLLLFTGLYTSKIILL